MSTLAMGFWQQQEHGMGRSFALSAFVHIILAVVLFLGVRWQVHPPDTVTVDLVDAPPPPPPPAVEAPKPPPKPEPVIKPEPRVEKPQIAIPEKPKPKPKPKPEAKPKEDPEFQKRLREQVAQEQKALDQQRQERELRELIARQQADAVRVQAAARAKALNEYIGRIQAKVKSNWILPQDLQGNPAAVFDVIQLPTGEVLSIRLVKSSGNAAYDAAVERAILKSSPLPLPASRELFSRELRLTFHPQDK
ncbi:MAG TPA: energy transducer TonB [Burkholderiales bacterium]|nr:energy transducer TonB [Burkholderiales bacterium]